MIVTDASVLTTMLAATDDQAKRVRAVLRDDPMWAAPAHWKTEVFSALRGLDLGGKLAAGGDGPLGLLNRLIVETVQIDGLLAHMWQLRHEISGYDAAYVALAAERDLTLVTADARLARAAVAHCRVQLVA